MKVLYVYGADGAIVYSLGGVSDRIIEEEAELWAEKEGHTVEVVEEEDFYSPALRVE